MTYLILHGSFAKPEDNWFTWLKLKLEDAKNKVYFPAMPVDNYQTFQKDATSTIQNLDSWLDTLKPIADEIVNANQPLTIVAHSISPAFVLSLMEANPKLKLEKLIAIAPFLHHGRASEGYWQIRDVNDSFLKNDEAIISDEARLKHIKNRIKKSLVIYGDNDPYVAPSESLEYAELLGSEVLVIKGGGHLNAEAGFTEFDQLLSLI
jgi:predicted alpha/beta hydrolase family esterase